MTMKASKRLVIVLLFLAGGIRGVNGQRLTPLYQFSGTDGLSPAAALVQGSDGNFYGTTTGVGVVPDVTVLFGENDSAVYGTVFRISLSGVFTNLYLFSGSDGANPYAALVLGVDGNLYGTTRYGGTNGYGTVFRMSTNGSLTTLYQFGSGANDGQNPVAGLVQGSDGNFYGTTGSGGTNGYGTVFRITPSGLLTNLHLFRFVDGSYPVAGLVQSSDGNFYGTTFYGGTNGAGTVFEITPQGTLTTLYQFGGLPTDGLFPAAGLAQDSDGWLYGTTYEGGTNDYGTVFKISPQGTLSTLYQFGGLPTDGILLVAGLVRGSDGSFYGTTEAGGTNTINCGGGCGTEFRISSAGTMTVLCQSSGLATDGVSPEAGLVQGSDGCFYGTTYQGGTNGDGTVFKVSVPLSPPANQIAGFQFVNVFDSAYAAFLISSVAGETYQLQYTDSMNPANWINSGGSITSIGGALTTFDLVQPLTAQRFYRFAITP
jgi:uncharacterized repeat protein (TIGR03803 family)